MGASAVNSNGTVVSRIGSAAVAMMADAAGVPVIICCETYKFSNKVDADQDRDPVFVADPTRLSC